MKNTKIIIIIAALLILVAGGSYLYSWNQSQTEQMFIVDWHTDNNREGYFIIGQPVDYLNPETGMFEAAVEDGECTQEEVDADTCLNGLSYIREKGEEITLPLDKRAIFIFSNQIEFYASDVVKHANKYQSAYLLRLTIKRGVVTEVEEVFIP